MVKVTKSSVKKGKPEKPPTEPPPIEPPVEPPPGDPVSGTFKGTVTPEGGGEEKPIEGTFSGHVNHDSGEFSVMGVLIKSSSTPGPTGWNTLKIGAGGWITGLDIADDGATVIRTDTYGAYYRANHTVNTWTQLLTTTAMPAADVDPELTDHGVYEICIAHSNSQIIYMLWDEFLFKSTNAGTLFTKTTFPALLMWPNGSYRISGPRMAIHPTDPSKLIATNGSAAYYSIDSGATWTVLSGVLNPTTSGSAGTGFCVAFDPTTPTTVYVASGGRGVYRSTTGVNGTFSLLASGPSVVKRIAVGVDGVMMATEFALDAGEPSGYKANGLWKYASGAWTNFSIKANAVSGSAIIWHSACPDPDNAGHWYIGAETGNVLIYTADNGTNFTGIPNQSTRVAPDIPWHVATNEQYMANGDMRFDPNQSNVLFFAEGIGMWWCNPPTTNTAYNWYEDSMGIEQLVMSKIVSPPSGDLIAAVWDRTIFKLTDRDTYATDHGPDHGPYIIRHGWSCAYATQDPDVIIGNFNADSFILSTDGGTTWTIKTAPAGTTYGGSVAASTATNFVWANYANGPMKYTTNAGTSWGDPVMTGVPSSGEIGWGSQQFVHRYIVCADHVTPNVFYAYNNGAAADTSYAGVWKTTDGGANWTRVYTTRLPVTGSGAASDYGPNAYNAVLESVPGNAGHLLFTGGFVGGSVTGFLLRSLDGGVTWAAFPGIVEALSVGCGKAGPGGYPTVHIAGWKDGVYGVWVSENANAATIASVVWTRIDGTSDGYPLGRFDQVTHVCGDLNTYGITYVSYRGSGAIYYRA